MTDAPLNLRSSEAHALQRASGIIRRQAAYDMLARSAQWPEDKLAWACDKLDQHLGDGAAGECYWEETCRISQGHPFSQNGYAMHGVDE